MIKTFDELCVDESICNYCKQTDYGEHKECVTPDGYWCCEDSAMQTYHKEIGE